MSVVGIMIETGRSITIPNSQTGTDIVNSKEIERILRWRGIPGICIIIGNERLIISPAATGPCITSLIRY